MPVTLRAPPVLLPPLKAPVDEGPEEVDEPDPGVDVLETEEPEVDVRLGLMEVEVPFPDTVEEDITELEERAAPISKAAVLESTVVTSPIGEAWKVYPEPGGTTGMTTLRVPSEVVTTFFKAKVLRKISLVK